MNGRAAKSLRKKARQEASKRDQKIIPELKDFLNKLSLWERVVLAWRLVKGVF